ncbi:clostripain-related cysteine peptidase [Burkholderia vietnamiensis]|uniref:clostripain-related cysteine peptidase n=1 Tax=Burkholderia vietnamiensis TaxID=60552 RepID=UPI001CF3766E|nr:clostripain-related cysteine peptidase [Burkholderia vietnamiensis]MCA8291879.1 clostripain-related cysteine peptidase [Burkholderia vietnamiensis]
MALTSRRVREFVLMYLAGTLLALMLAACGGGDNEIDSSGLASRTVLVYLSGSNLTDSAQASLEQMTETSAGNQVRFVVTTGAGTESHGDVIWTKVQRWLIAGGRRTKLDDPPAQADLTKPDALQDFLVWGIKAYPAQRYAVILNDHGGAYDGFGYAGKENSHLSLDQLASAFKNAQSATGATFDLIGFDACMMASVEVAAAMKPYGRYLAASEDLEYGSWDYAAIASGLANNPRMDGLALGRLIADSYYDSAGSGTDDAAVKQIWTADFTFSVTDLQQIDPLLQEVNQLGDELGSGKYLATKMADIRSQIQSFSTDWIAKTDVVDLLQLSRGLMGLQPPLTSSDAVVGARIKNAVVYQRVGSARADVAGLNIFMPAMSIYDPAKLKYYASLGTWQGGYRNFIGDYAEALATALDVAINISKPVCTGDVVSSYASLLGTWKTETPLAQITYWRSKDTSDYVTAIFSIDAASSILAGDVNIDPDDFREVKFNRNDGIPMINGVPVSMIPTTTPAVGSDAKYLIPITKIEGSSSEGGFLLVQEGQSGQIVVSNYVSSLSSAVGHTLKVDPKWKLVASTWVADDWSPNENQIIKMPGETAMVFKRESIPSSVDKNFYQSFNFQFGVIDLANRIHLSDLIGVPSQGQPCAGYQ